MTSTDNRNILFGGIESQRALTFDQAWFMMRMIAKFSICLLAVGRPSVETSAITGIKKMNPLQIVDALSSILRLPDNPYAITLYYDGNIGHCVTLIRYDVSASTFIYHDPWPQTSLLCRENNGAGIDAKRVGKQLWSITDIELEKVIFAFFIDLEIIKALDLCSHCRQCINNFRDLPYLRASQHYSYLIISIHSTPRKIGGTNNCNISVNYNNFGM